jgi:hypothetical protein
VTGVAACGAKRPGAPTVIKKGSQWFLWSAARLERRASSKHGFDVCPESRGAEHALLLQIVANFSEAFVADGVFEQGAISGQAL